MTFEDSGELVTCAATLGNAHPPGYVLHALLGRLALTLPVGVPAFRTNLLSAAAGSLAVVLLGVVVFRVVAGTGAPRRSARAGAVTAMAAIGLAPTVLWEAQITEKYALFLACFAGAAAALATFRQSGATRDRLAAAGLCGLAASTHLMGIVLLPAAVATLARRLTPRAAVLAVVMALLPFSLKTGYHPVRAGQVLPFNWETPTTASRLVAYLGVSRYRGRVFRLAESQAFAAQSFDLVRRVPWREFGGALLVALGGAWACWRTSRWTLGVAGSVVAVTLLLVPAWKMPQAENKFLAADWAVAGLAGAGVAGLAALWPPLAWTPVALVLSQLAARPGERAPSRRYAAANHAANLCAGLGDGDVVMDWSDLWSFPLRHAAALEGRGPATLLSWEATVFGVPPRRDLERLLGPRAETARWLDAGAALDRAVAGALAPRRLFLTPELPGGQRPAEGTAWRGLLLRVVSSGRSRATDSDSFLLWRAFRLRDFLAPRNLQERRAAAFYAAAAAEQAGTLAGIGRFREAAWLGRVAARLNRAAQPRGLDDPGLTRWLDASARARATLAVHPRDGAAAETLVGAGAYFADQGDRPRARVDWADAWQAGFRPAALNLGHLALLEERFSDALRWYGRSGGPEAQAAMAEARAASAGAAAVPALALQAASGDPAALCDLGNALFAAGRWRVAEATYRLATLRDPGSARAWRNLGAALFRQGRTRESITTTRRALALAPEDPSALANLRAAEAVSE